MQNQDLNQLKKGVLKLIVLQVISEGETYGYEMILRIDKKSQGMFKMKEGTLYPILYRLEDEGLIVSTWHNPDKKQKAKKYYSITDLGRERVKTLTDTWLQLVTAVNSFIDCGGILE